MISDVLEVDDVAVTTHHVEIRINDVKGISAEKNDLAIT